MASIYAQYLGLKKETTWGTAVTPDRFIPIGPDGISVEGGPEHIKGEGLYAGKFHPQKEEAVVGDETYRITTGFQLYDHAQGILLEALMGAVATTGAGPYTHTYTVAEPLPSFTIQHVIIDTTGTARARTYAGCVVESGELKMAVGKIATIGLKWSAQSETIATAAATNVIPSNLVPVHARNIAVTAFAASLQAKELTLAWDNKLSYDERRFLGSPLIGARQVGLSDREITGDLALEFADNFTWWTRVKAGTFGALSVVATVGSNTLTFAAANIKALGEPPNASTRGLAEQPVKFEAYGTGATAPITITAVNTDTTS